VRARPGPPPWLPPGGNTLLSAETRCCRVDRGHAAVGRRYRDIGVAGAPAADASRHPGRAQAAKVAPDGLNQLQLLSVQPALRQDLPNTPSQNPAKPCHA